MFFDDDIPVWGFVGKVVSEKAQKEAEEALGKTYLFTHFHFDISYNEDHVIELNVSSDPKKTVDITKGSNVTVDFSYSVKWRETHIELEDRMDRYTRYSFLPEHLEVRHPSYVLACVVATISVPFAIP
jgi:hypothetical protein